MLQWVNKWWPFVLLCAVAANEWLLTDAWPQVGTTVTSAAIGCALAALVLAGAKTFTHEKDQAKTSSFALGVLGGVMVVVGPMLGLLVGASRMEPADLALSLALTPVVIAVADASGGMETARLWPGLAAVVGLMLMLAVPSFADWRTDVVMGLVPVVTGVGCVLFRELRWEWTGVWALSGAAVVFGIGVAVWGGGLVWGAVGVSTVLVLLGMMALERVSARQFGARFVIVPLVILVEGFAGLHSVPTWRSAACGLLLAVSAVALLRGNPADAHAAQS